MTQVQLAHKISLQIVPLHQNRTPSEKYWNCVRGLASGLVSMLCHRTESTTSDTHRVVETRPMRADRADDQPLKVVVDCLLGKAELEALPQVLRRLVAEGRKAR